MERSRRVQLSIGRVRATLLAVTVSSCGFSQEKETAAAFVDAYFKAATATNVSAVLPFYSQQFFAVTPRATWIRTLQDMRGRCGSPTSHSLKGWRIDNGIGTESGSTADLVYDVRYVRCELTETISVFRTADGAQKILGHILKVEHASPSAPSSARGEPMSV